MPYRICKSIEVENGHMPSTPRTRVASFSVRAVNYESILDHNAFAVVASGGKPVE
jgi:GTP cyclohydrolase FolE2